MDNSKLTIDINALALQIAQSQIGQHETANNSGPMVDKYLKAVGLAPGYAWCQAFVYYCYEEAANQLGIKNPVPRTAGVKACWNMALGGQKLTAAMCVANSTIIEPGDQFILLFNSTQGHTGIVERVEGNILHTIEGNSNNDGSREGTTVVRHTRDMHNKIFLGVIRY